MEHLNMTTPDGAQLNLDALYKIYPSCFTETAAEDGSIKRVVDWNKLRALLGDYAEENAPESYDFTWVGKRAAQREAAAPIKKTLRPCPEESVDWENTQNLYIEGDNLEVLKLLQNSYMGKVKMIYIDPPYNTGNDFVYHDDFAQSADEYDEHNINEDGERFRKNTDSNGRFHSDWCSMMYARLMLARTLLSNTGSIFITVDDHEYCNVKKICDEIFGESSFIATIIWENFYGRSNAAAISPAHNYILLYSKSGEDWKLYRNLLDRDEKSAAKYKNPDNDPLGPWRLGPIFASGERHEGLMYTITTPSGKKVTPPKGSHWRMLEKDFWEMVDKGRIVFGESGDNIPATKLYLSEVQGGMVPRSIWLHDEAGHTQEGKREIQALFPDNVPFDTPKPTKLLKQCITIAANADDIVMDFFSGSASTADAVIQLNAEKGAKRKFIMVQIPDIAESGYLNGENVNICEIGKERIRRAGRKIKSESPLTTQDLDIGFRVFKCDDSNMKDVYFAPNDYSQGFLSQLEDNIKEDRTDLDLLFDCMLRWGVELSLPLSSKKVGACTIHNVNDGDLVACFDGTITDHVIDAIADMSPLRVVFRDSSFEEASQKMNLFELFKQKCGWSDYEVRNNVKVI